MGCIAVWFLYYHNFYAFIIVIVVMWSLLASDLSVKKKQKTKQKFTFWDNYMLNNALQDNLFEWHFTIRGPADSEFDGGLYHGRIILPPEYPMKPPSIILLTVSTRSSLCPWT